jgi:hypothetical protein
MDAPPNKAPEQKKPEKHTSLVHRSQISGLNGCVSIPT